MADGANVGKAYVQILPTMDGFKGKITKLLNSESSSAADSAGSSAGSSWASKFISVSAKAIAAAGLGKMLKESLDIGADLEQQLGGIETLFGDAYDTVVANAEAAFKTSGVSMNSYMSQVTSFSASLLQSLDGDTTKAAASADMAIQDMADNANKMGTSIESIQNAYQGFAKQNYTMLDNLKLGYGGTKEEMERLLADAQELTGIEYDIDNLNDVYNAIHVIQQSLGITGTTAKEAAETFSGSFASMAAAAENLLGAMMMNGKNGINVEDYIMPLFETVQTFVFGNLIPAIGRWITSLFPIIGAFITEGIPMLQESIEPLISSAVEYITSNGTRLILSGANLITQLSTGVLNSVPTVLSTFNDMVLSLLDFLLQKAPLFITKGAGMVTNMLQGIVENVPLVTAEMSSFVEELIELLKAELPRFLEQGVASINNILDGIIEAIPSVMTEMTNFVSNMINLLKENLPFFLEKGAETIQNLLQGLSDRMPDLIGGLADGLADMIYLIASNLPEFLEKGIEIVGELLSGLIESIPDILAKIPGWLKEIGEAFMDKDWGKIGKDIIKGIASGITNAVTGLVDSAIKACKKLVKSVKEFFGIASPSKLFEKEVGYQLPAGEAKGVVKNLGVVDKAMDKMNDHVMNGVADLTKPVTLGLNTANGQYGGTTNYGGVTINVYAKDGQSAKEIAEEVSEILDQKIKRKGAIYG